MIYIYDANAFLRQSLNRAQLGVIQLDPRMVYHRTNANPHPEVWVWDGPNNNARRQAIFDGYKRRDYEGQENIFAGLTVYRELLSLSKALQITVPNYEADDVCATLARHYCGRGVPVTLWTNDFDFFQLQGLPGLKLEGVKPKEGILPRYVCLYKALVGDPSDKIPGIPGFGQKTFSSLYLFHGDIDAACRDRDVAAMQQFPFPPRVKSFLAEEANCQQVFDFYQITQMLDVPLDLIAQHTKVGTPDPIKAEQLFKRFMF